MAKNMRMDKNAMPEQPAEVRNKNFLEVALGYTAEQAMDEARRCLSCRNRPCVSGCPVGVDIPGFIAKVAEGDFAGAYEVLSRDTSLPAICGRVCPQETQCEEKCVRALKGESVGIGRLERFVADWKMAQGEEAVRPPVPNGHRVAVIGSGPSGLACAGDLAKKGYEVTIFEALHAAGGVLVYGIPEFRLPKEIVRREIAGLGRQDVGAHLSGELVLGHVDGLPPVQHGEVSVQQLDVEAEGRLVVDGALPVPGRRLRVDGVEVVVHGDGVGLDAHFLQLLFDLQCRGGLAGAGGAGQQDDAGLLPVIGNLLGRRLHFFGKGGVARLRKALGVRADSVVDLFQGIGHGDAPFTVLHKRRRRRSGWPATSPAAGYTRWDISR